MTDFSQAKRQFERLRVQWEQGALDEEQYRFEVAKLLLRDADGAFWMIDANSGAWFCNRGEGWVEADAAQAEAAAQTAGRRGETGAARRGARRRLLTAGGLLLILAAAAAAIVLRGWPFGAVPGPAATAAPTAQVEVAIASPPDGGTVALGQEVGIEAMLEAGSGLPADARVELQIGGEAVATQPGQAILPGQTLPMSFPWRPKAAGEHEISVAVLDEAGVLLGRDTIHLHVGEDPGEIVPGPACTPDAAFLADVTIPPGAEFAPGARMEKVWQVRNSGTCAWGVDYELVRTAGEGLSAADQVAVPPTAAGEAANLEVVLVAPDEVGSYSSAWRLRSPQHVFFGPQLTISVEVKSLAESSLPPQAPANPRARISDDGQAVRLTWEDQSDNEDAFRIYREDVEASIGLVPADSQLFVDRSATCGHVYRYGVVAFNAAGSSALAEAPPVTLPRCALRDEAPTLALTVVPTEVLPGGTFTVTVQALDDVAVAQVLIRGEDTGDSSLDQGRLFACGEATCTASWPLSWSGEVSATLTFVAVARDSGGQESEPARVEVRIRPR
jgi:hypothetical protein